MPTTPPSPPGPPVPPDPARRRRRPRPAPAGTPASGAARPAAPPVSGLWWVTAPVLAVLVATIVIIGAMRVPYVVLSAGGARPVEQLVRIRAVPGGPKVTTEPADPGLLYLTVSLREPTAFEALVDVFREDQEVDPSAPFFGTQTSQENQKLDLALMTDSQLKAKKVALERLGYHVEATPVGAFIEDVDPSFPAAKVLKPGATVIGVDGKAVSSADELVAAIQAHHPGDRIELRLIPLGATRPTTITTTLGKRQDDPKVAVLGVEPVDRSTYSYPVDIDIDTEHVGGPSAGLAFTLAILDRMTPGSLLGHQKVAVTGTIELDGTVGPVGGVDHKTRAAISEGAKLMIVPPDEYALARKTARGRLEVERASTLDQALAILAHHGGDPLPAKAR